MLKEIEVRPYRPEDFERLCQIHDAARLDELELAGLVDAFLPLDIAADREGLFEYRVIVAEVEGVVAGFAAFSAGELAWLYVDREYCRQGIGAGLVDAALQQMDDAVSIEVLAGNLPALALYKKFGFEVETTQSGRMPGNEEFSVTVHVLSKLKGR
ncbi:MAG: GNAT family N-acetyltransferase [Rothia sp. (in: high G+C Gram-positive bacteria)]|nr:GNAT family N-acetyltransferase [Rothia sp. (in: high G+C Gram-positive bacteria)]